MTSLFCQFSPDFLQESCSLLVLPLSKLHLQGCLRIFLNNFLLPKIKLVLLAWWSGSFHLAHLPFLACPPPVQLWLQPALDCANAVSSAPGPLLTSFSLECSFSCRKPFPLHNTLQLAMSSSVLPLYFISVIALAILCW